jgi:hypothetical protein
MCWSGQPRCHPTANVVTGNRVKRLRGVSLIGRFAEIFRLVLYRLLTGFAYVRGTRSREAKSWRLIAQPWGFGVVSRLLEPVIRPDLGRFGWVGRSDHCRSDGREWTRCTTRSGCGCATRDIVVSTAHDWVGGVARKPGFARLPGSPSIRLVSSPPYLPIL